jgi:hypothetical protein
MEKSNMNTNLILQFERNITYAVEEKLLSGSKMVLPYFVSNDNNLKCRDFDVNIGFNSFTKSKPSKSSIKLAKITPVQSQSYFKGPEKDEKDENGEKEKKDDLFCDMV